MGDGPRVEEWGEDALLATILPGLRQGPEVIVGPGDDAAVVRGTGELVITTDTMVRDVDWRDDWSSPDDVGRKLACQNLADVAAMGAVPVAVVTTVVMPGSTSVSWVHSWLSGVAREVQAAGASVVGGDLAGTDADIVMVSVTAQGALTSAGPVLRSGASPGDILAVTGTLGVSAAGLALLQAGRANDAPEWVRFHVAPTAPYGQGPIAAAAGATSMIDLSDGLLRDLHRVAHSSGVSVHLQRAYLDADVQRLRSVLGEAGAWECVTAGGEEHALLATFPRGTSLPEGWRPLGEIREGTGVWCEGEAMAARGWDHFGG